MKRRKEALLWQAMRRAKPVSVRLERVENLLEKGMPDVHALYDGRACWIELKAAVLPARETTRVLGRDGVSIEQVCWHRDYEAYGGISYILIRDSKLGLYLIPAARVREVNEMTAAQLRAASLASTWDDIFGVIGGIN